MSTALEAVRARRSWSKVTETAPTRTELLPLVSAAGRVADHSSLRPWRLIELRGDDRVRLGEAIALAQGDEKPSTKPLRAPLLIAVVASYRKSEKVPRWEQEAVASGVAHVLSLLLDDAGWGVIWRTGHYTRSAPVARAHGLGEDEELLGWLYVGGKPAGARHGRRKAVDARSHVQRMPSVTTPGADDVPEAEQDAAVTAKASLPKEGTPKKAKLSKKEKKRLKKAKKKRMKAAKKAAL
jgi:nitroreductase